MKIDLVVSKIWPWEFSLMHLKKEVCLRIPEYAGVVWSGVGLLRRKPENPWWSKQVARVPLYASAPIAYQSVRTLQKMALLRCCGREALVHKWRTRKKEKAVCTTCQIVTLREKLKVITVLKDVLYVFISLGVVYLVFLDAVSRRYGKKHEEVDRH